MATQAMHRRKRPRKVSFPSGKKAVVESHFRAYAQQGLSVVDIMFKLHDNVVADVP